MNILIQFQHISLRSNALRCAALALSLVFLPVVFAPVTAWGDDGEFWDAAIASLVYTKRVERSHFQLKAGMGALGKLDTPTDTPATWRILAEGTFYGFKKDRYEKLFSMYGNLALGIGDDADNSLDAWRARLSVYSFMKGGAFSLGMLSAERDKGVNMAYNAKVRSFEYAAGGEMKFFAIALNTSALGYEFIRYYAKDGYEFLYVDDSVDPPIETDVLIRKHRDDYHGLLIFELALKIGFVLGKDAPFSFESNIKSDVAFSYPRQKDVGTAFEMVGHFNNRVLPMDLSLVAGHRYSVDDRDGEDGPSFHDSYFYTSALLGIRY